MSTTPFEDLCTRLCEHLRLECPSLQPTGAPVPALRVWIGGAEVDLLQASPANGDWGVMMVELGELPRERQAQASLTLLQSNFMLMGACPSVFAVHPVTGHAVVYQPFAVASVDVHRLDTAARHLAGIGVRWRQGEFLPPDEAGISPASPPFGSMAMNVA